MEIIEKNQGRKIDFDVNGTNITFADELMLKLAKLQRDDPVHKDICFDRDGELVIGTAAGWAYVAEIDIPAKEYEYHEAEEGEEPEPPTPLPLDMDKVILSLWSVEK
ncbi:MAG: hypothetical protein IKN04_18310 [Clostridia bacterium]|nr:hypothetical protein [Clostridia bacterium]